MTIGICGTGQMGTAMAEHLLELGEELVVWNRTRARTDLLSEQGAAVADSAADLVARADPVIVMLIDDAAAVAVYGGAEGLLAGPLAGRLISPLIKSAPSDSLVP